MWAIYRKEMRQYLLTPTAWIVWVTFLLLVGWVFPVFLSRLSDAYMSQNVSPTDMMTAFLNFIRFLLLIAVPVFSMRLFAEEKQMGTLEVLFTYPLTEAQLIFGKLLAALTVCAIMLSFTVVPIFWVSLYGQNALDWPVLFCCYFGMMLMVTDFLTLGIFVSSLTGSQVIAFFCTLIPLLGLWLASAIIPADSLAPVPATAHWWQKINIAKFIHSLSLLDHYESFGRGIINSTDVLFYVSLAAFFVFLTVKQLEARKWRG